MEKRQKKAVPAKKQLEKRFSAKKIYQPNWVRGGRRERSVCPEHTQATFGAAAAAREIEKREDGDGACSTIIAAIKTTTTPALTEQQRLKTRTTTANSTRGCYPIPKPNSNRAARTTTRKHFALSFVWFCLFVSPAREAGDSACSKLA